MLRKKLLTMAVVGVILLSGVVFSTVYKGRTEEQGESVQVETVAPKETEEIKKKVDNGMSNTDDSKVKTDEPQERIIIGEDGKSYVVGDNTGKEIEDSKVKRELELEESLSVEGNKAQEAADSEEIPDTSNEETISAEEYSEMLNDLKSFTDEQSENIWNQARGGE